MKALDTDNIIIFLFGCLLPIILSTKLIFLDRNIIYNIFINIIHHYLAQILFQVHCPAYVCWAGFAFMYTMNHDLWLESTSLLYIYIFKKCNYKEVLVVAESAFDTVLRTSGVQRRMRESCKKVRAGWQQPDAQQTSSEESHQSTTLPMPFILDTKQNTEDTFLLVPSKS